MPVSDEMIERLRVATEALGSGDPEPFAKLFAPNAEWRGVPHGMRWWKETPS